MDKDTMLFLIKGGHLSIPEREELGILHCSSLKFDDLVMILSETILSQKWFPSQVKPPAEGEAIYEGGIIERIADNKFVYHQQRSYADNPFVKAEGVSKIFNSAKQISEYYLKNELHLPGTLDGFKVE